MNIIYSQCLKRLFIKVLIQNSSIIQSNSEIGICKCENFCKGQGTGDGEGECKRITMSIFRTGTNYYYGCSRIKQIEAAYAFLNKVFDKHHKTVLYEPNTA